MCARRYGKEGLKITFSQSTGTTRPLMISKPCGVCIQLLEARIQNAEMSVPIATMIVAKKCKPGPTLFHPNCVENDRRCSDGGRADDRLSHGALLFIDDEASKERTMTSSTWVPPLAFDWFGFTLAGSIAAPATNASLNQIERIARSYGG